MAETAGRISDILSGHVTYCNNCGNKFKTMAAQTETRDGQFIDGVYVLDNYTVRCPYCDYIVWIDLYNK